jgi:hypothetical protein
MKIDTLIFGLAPAVAGILVVFASVWSIVRSPRVIQFALGVPIIGLTIVSLWMLWRIWHGAWPSYLPLMLVATVIPVSAVQIYLAKRE